MTNKVAALSGSIKPLRGNEETGSKSSQAFKLSVAGHVPSFSLAFAAKSGSSRVNQARSAQLRANLKQFCLSRRISTINGGTALKTCAVGLLGCPGRARRSFNLVWPCLLIDWAARNRIRLARLLIRHAWRRAALHRLTEAFNIIGWHIDRDFLPGAVQHKNRQAVKTGRV